jgi:multidrug efflux pump subunit AcrA (membrane-fusion protein)
VFAGKVTLISPTLDARTRTVPIEAEFENAEGLIKPGFFAECSVELTRRERTFMVPTTAIHESENGQYVIIHSDGEDREIPVIVVRQMGANSRVIGNLEDRQRVVLHR